MTMNPTEAVLARLLARSTEATVCPSEVARTLAGTDATGWRGLMPVVHAAVDDLLAKGMIELSWKGRRLINRVGPYRIRRK